MVFISDNRSFLRSTSQSNSAQVFTPQSNLTADPLTRVTATRRQGASDQGGNTLAAAKLIPTPGKKRIVDTVRRNDFDFFKLEITAPSNITFQVRNRSDVRLTASILDSRGQVVSYEGRAQTGTIAGGDPISNVYRGVQPGTYYLRFRTVSRQAVEYELKLKVIDPTAPVDCGCGS